jgi:site-specific DNA recombinase
MRNRNPKTTVSAKTKTVRCAIYTRKSTQEGLEQDFNSLDAQREAAEAYIASQRSEGWVTLPDRYDDGGYTGGNTDRPALQRLLEDIKARRVDCVVVYKVDRLSRSLLDFAKMMEVFERHGVSFVSVTQQFSTTNSMGRLTLNILLSFAQFEREIISERTRDKMSAARRKGKWIGGYPVLGYDIDSGGGRLVVNRDEARRVRRIFELYLEHEALLSVLSELDRQGWRNKRWTTQEGVTRGGLPFTKASLYNLLTNRVYCGRVDFRGAIYEGEHEAIIDQAVWDRVQETLRQHGQTKGAALKNKYGALLRGLLFCASCGTPMIHSCTARGSKRWRYYICYNAQQRGWQNCETKSVSAPVIEGAIVEAIRKLGSSPEIAGETALKAREQILRKVEELQQNHEAAQTEFRRLNAELGRLAGDASPSRYDRILALQPDVQAAEGRLASLAAELRDWQSMEINETDLARALTEFEPVWKSLTTAEQTRLVKLTVESVAYGKGGKVTINFRTAGLRELCNGGLTTSEQTR